MEGYYDMAAPETDAAKYIREAALGDEIPDMSKQHEKNATVTIKLKAKSGYMATIDADISAAQWAAINAIIDATP